MYMKNRIITLSLREIKKTLVPFEEIEGRGVARTFSAQKANLSSGYQTRKYPV